METCAIILPKIERLVTSLGHQYPCQIRRLTYGEERQVVVESISDHAPKVGVVRQPWAGGRNPFGIVCTRTRFPIRHIFELSNRIRRLHLHAGTWVGLRRRLRDLAQVFDFKTTNKVTAGTIFSGGHIFVIVVSPVPLSYQRVGADCKFAQTRFLMQDAHQFAVRIENAEADRSFQWRRNEADARASRG